MSGDNRLFLIGLAGSAALFCAFGLGLLLGPSNFEEQRYQPYRYAADKPLEVDYAAATELNTKAFLYRTPCSNPKGRDESDLCAQWRAARAAEESAFWTKWGFWVSLGGIIGLLATIIQGRIALSRAYEANRITRENSRSELRAYVIHDELKWLHYQSHGSVLIDRWGVSAVWANAGATPTRSLQLQIWAHTAASENPTDLPFDYVDPDPTPSLFVAPNKTLNGAEFSISPNEIKLVKDGRLFLFVGGWAIYRDVLPHSPEYVTKFCFRVFVSGGDPTMVTSDENKITFTCRPYGLHNCADEECDCT